VYIKKSIPKEASKGEDAGGKGIRNGLLFLWIYP
jgi:hypothetical protein